MFLRPTIAKEVKKRGITLLLHSTHLYKNLPLILEDGWIHSARELIDRYGLDHAARLLHDPRRYEQFAVGLDYINASLTTPNVELLYHRSQTVWQSEWVHLALDLSLLSLPTTRFSPVSAASARGRHIAPGLDGFRAMFAAPPGKPSRGNLSPAQPTHPQAEVLILGPLRLSWIRAILVPHRNTLHEVARLCEHHMRDIPVEITPHLFVWPAHLTSTTP